MRSHREERKIDSSAGYHAAPRASASIKGALLVILKYNTGYATPPNKQEQRGQTSAALPLTLYCYVCWHYCTSTTPEVEKVFAQTSPRRGYLGCWSRIWHLFPKFWLRLSRSPISPKPRPEVIWSGGHESDIRFWYHVRIRKVTVGTGAISRNGRHSARKTLTT